MAKLIQNRWWIFAGFVLIVALSRLLPHPYNFTPVGGMALFAGGILSSKRLFWIVPLIAYWISDLLVMNLWYAADGSFIWGGVLSVYISLFGIILLGKWLLKKVTIPRMAGATVGASVMFFIITNFQVWIISPMYPTSWAGLIECYTLALPFFWNTLAGDAFYVTLLFGSYQLVTHYYPQFRLKTSKVEA